MCQFSASPQLVDFGRGAYRRRSNNTSLLLRQLFERLAGEGLAMAYTIEDFKRDYVKEHFADTATMRRVTYSTSLTPNWINGGDSLWYSWRDRLGCGFLVAYPRTKVKSARLLATGQTVAFEQDDYHVRFKGLPAKAPDEPVTTLVVECESEPKQDELFVRRRERGAV